MWGQPDLCDGFHDLGNEGTLPVPVMESVVDENESLAECDPL